MSLIFAIDPGPIQSAWVVYDPTGKAIIHSHISFNMDLCWQIHNQAWADHYGNMELVIEDIACYGMPVGREVFVTCIWIGRFYEAWHINTKTDPTLIERRKIKLHLCNSARAKDANIRQAVIDRFGPDRKTAIGTKKNPGPLYGIKTDMWSALAIAITQAELIQGASQNDKTRIK